MDNDTGEILTAREVLARLKISQATLDRWTSSGRLPALRLPNGYRRYRVEDVDALLRSKSEYETAVAEWRGESA